MYTYYLYAQAKQDGPYLFLEEQININLANNRVQQLVPLTYFDIIIKEKQLRYNPTPPAVGTNFVDAESMVLIDG